MKSKISTLKCMALLLAMLSSTQSALAEGPDGLSDFDPYWIQGSNGRAICGRVSPYPNGYLVQRNGIEYCRNRRGSYFRWSADSRCMEWTQPDGWPVMELPLRYCESR